MKDYFEHHGAKTIFFSRFVFGTRVSTAILAGGLNMNYRKFFRSNVLGAGAWAVVSSFLGYVFGHSFVSLRQYLHTTEVSLLILVLIVFIILILRFLFNRTNA